jgi:uncharacterized protein YjbI with pentapeptide repeats
MDLQEALLTAMIPFVGWLSTAVFTNTKRAQRLRTIGESFEKLSLQLTTYGPESNSNQRLIAAVRLRRFFDKSGEHSIRHMFQRTCPYEKDALSVMTALLKTKFSVEDAALQKTLADGLAYANDIAGADLQEADLSNAFLGSRSGNENMSLSDLDFYKAKLIKASLKSADCSRAKFVSAEMSESVLTQAKLHGTDFRWSNLEKARFNKADLTNANFEGANLTNANFSEAILRNCIFKDSVLNGARFTNAIDIPETISAHLREIATSPTNQTESV